MLKCSFIDINMYLTVTKYHKIVITMDNKKITFHCDFPLVNKHIFLKCL